MTNVVSLKAVREMKDAEQDDMAYRALILTMDKLELLEEMVRFQEERSRIGHLTLTMMVRGKYLFKALEESAETQELRLLTKSYRRHLEFELQEYTKRDRDAAAAEAMERAEREAQAEESAAE
jgi:hypothetical protein